MIISGFNEYWLGPHVRVQACAEWEQVERDRVFPAFEAPADAPVTLKAEPNAFLAAAYVPAWNAGESRLRVSERICPVLWDRLLAVGVMLEHWYPEMGPPPVIEAQATETYKPNEHKSFSLLSCGVDSLCTIWRNYQFYPRDHPRAVDSAVTIFFSRLPPNRAVTSTSEQRQVEQKCGNVCRDLGMASIPVWTNLMELEPNGFVFSYKWHGAALSCVTHCFADQESRLSIASSSDYTHLKPWGSHPMLDPLYGSANLDIEHDAARLTRFAKTQAICEWQAALDNLRVCQGRQVAGINCGSCEKCIRTKTALVALNALARSAAFIDDDLPPDLLKTVAEYEMLSNVGQLSYYEALCPALRQAGRDDLARTIDEIVYYYKRSYGGSNAGQSDQYPSEPFLVADDATFGGPVIEGHGHYWGQPDNGAQAIAQLSALKRVGYRILLMPKGSWWPEYFTGLTDYLEACGERGTSGNFHWYRLD